MIKYTFDIHTHQPVYVVCDVNHQALMITTNICTAIRKLQQAK
jgi:nitrogenase subunit NifH